MLDNDGGVIPNLNALFSFFSLGTKGQYIRQGVMFPIANKQLRQYIKFMHKLIKIIFFSYNHPDIAPAIRQQYEIRVDFLTVINFSDLSDETVVKLVLIDTEVDPSEEWGSGFD